MKQSGHLNHSEETETGFPVTSKYGRIPPNKHGGVGRQQQQLFSCGQTGHIARYCRSDVQMSYPKSRDKVYVKAAQVKKTLRDAGEQSAAIRYGIWM